MSSQLTPLAQEDLDSTTDEDSCLSLKVKQLQSLKCHFSEDDHQSLEKTTIRRLDFGGLVKLTPFQKQLTETLTSTKSDLPESKTFYINESQDFLKASPSKTKKMFPEGILKSGNKSKYTKWQQSILEYQTKGSLSTNANPSMSLVPPYFLKGKEDKWEHWDKQQWEEEEEWWEADQWAASSPTYAKYKEESFSDYGFSSY